MSSLYGLFNNCRSYLRILVSVVAIGLWSSSLEDLPPALDTVPAPLVHRVLREGHEPLLVVSSGAVAGEN